MKKKLLRDMNRLECEIAIQDLDLEIASALICIDILKKDRFNEDHAEPMTPRQKLEASLPRLHGRIKSLEKAIVKIGIRERGEAAWCRRAMGIVPDIRKGSRRLEELRDDNFA